MTALATFLSGCTQFALPAAAPTTSENGITSDQVESSNFQSPYDSVLLPHGLYFLSDNQAGTTQVWRLAPDGKNLIQVTQEEAPIRSYDVSSENPGLAYLADNRLYIAGIDGKNSKLLLDGGQESNPGPAFLFQKRINAPLWSPNGQKLAFGHGGINIAQVSTGFSVNLLPNDADFSTRDSRSPHAQAIFIPYAWSPDESRLLFEISLSELGSTLGVLNLEDGSWIRLNGPDSLFQPGLVCCQAAWSPDSHSLWVSNPYALPGHEGGLWQYLVGSASGTALMPPTAADGTFNFAGWPTSDNSDGLMFFYANSPTLPQTSFPYHVINAKFSDFNQQNLLRTESFFPQEVLWDTKGQLAVIIQAAPGAAEIKEGGPVLLIRLDPAGINLPAHPLATDGFQLKWGP
jgi:hypothetical protein